MGASGLISLTRVSGVVRGDWKPPTLKCAGLYHRDSDTSIEDHFGVIRYMLPCVLE